MKGNLTLAATHYGATDHDADVFKLWTQDIPTNIDNAAQNWPGIKDKAPSTL